MKTFIDGKYRVIGDVHESHGDIKDQVFDFKCDNFDNIRAKELMWDNTVMESGYIICPPQSSVDIFDIPGISRRKAYINWVYSVLEKVE